MVSGLGASPRQRESYTWFTAELANLHDGASRARYGGSPMQDLTAHQSFGHSDCERIVGGTLAQPVLALTSLGYVAAGVAVLCWAARVMAPLAGLPEWRSWRSGPGASPTTDPSHHGRSAPTTCRWSPWLWCPPPAWLGARRQRWSTWATAAGVFAPGLAAYTAGRSGSQLCRPESPWQYHGAWHVLSAAAAGWAARAMAPGRPVPVNQRG